MNLIPFNFKGAEVRAIVGQDGEPWFVAKDIAETLGYADTDQAIRKHCKAVQTCPVDSTGQVRHIQIIPERDLYRLVMKSKLPAAETFEEWVVGEVLPSIRKTGGYGQGFSVPQTRAEALRLAADLEEQNAVLALENQQQALRIESMESIFQAGMTPTQFCKRLNGVNTQHVNGALLAIGWIYNAERDTGRSAKYRVASKARDKYLTEGVINIAKEGAPAFSKFTLVLLRRGAARLHELYLQEALPMKADWDGTFTHEKFALEGPRHD